MPTVRLASAGSQSVAKAGVNFQGMVETNASTVGLFPLGGLETPGLPKLTWLITQTIGAAGAIVQPQIAIRRGDIVGGQAAPFFVNLGPAALLITGVPTVFEFNAPAQAMRISITSPAGNATTCRVILLASG